MASIFVGLICFVGIMPYSFAFLDDPSEFTKNRSSIAAFPNTHLPYFDLTEALQQKNYFDIERTLNNTSNIFYSTNQLISEIANLSWVAEALSNRLSNTNRPLCLMVSFQMTKNYSNIDWKYMGDILNLKQSSESPENQKNLQILRKYLCKVALDFQINWQISPEYTRSSQYAAKNDISFTKYARKIISEIFGVEYKIPVGVIYSEFQVGSDKMLLEQEIRHADFITINVNYYPVRYMPLDYILFKSHLNEIGGRHTDFISEKTNSTKGPGIPVDFMLQWNNFNASTKQYFESELAAEAENKVYLSSEDKYLTIFQEHVKRAIGKEKIGVLSGTQINIHEHRLEEDSDRTNLQTYLYVQKSDTSACQLGIMLDQISKRYETLVVNEYTWSALASFQHQMLDSDYMATNCKRIPKVPKDFMLFASNGIGDLWNVTGKAYETLLWENQNIGDISLKTLVFSADDILLSLRNQESYYGYSVTDVNSNIGIKKFVGSWVEANMSRIGCLVDLSHLVENKGSVVDVVTWTENRCQPIFDNTSVVVWEISINDNDLIYMYNRTYKGQRVGLNEKLMNVLVAKEIYSKFNPGQEIVLSLTLIENSLRKIAGSDENDTSYFDESELSVEYWEWILFQWAYIHNVKMMSLLPAFDTKNPLRNGLNIRK